MFCRILVFLVNMCLNEYLFHVEVNLRYMILLAISEYGTIIKES